MAKLTNSLKSSFPSRLVLYIIAGVVISAIIFFALIFVGYSNLAGSGGATYQVSCLGLPIYEITRSGEDLIGNPVGANMSILGAALSLAIALVAELLLAAKNRGKDDDGIRDNSR